MTWFYGKHPIDFPKHNELLLLPVSKMPKRRNTSVVVISKSEKASIDTIQKTAAVNKIKQENREEPDTCSNPIESLSLQERETNLHVSVEIKQENTTKVETALNVANSM